MKVCKLLEKLAISGYAISQSSLTLRVAVLCSIFLSSTKAVGSIAVDCCPLHSLVHSAHLVVPTSQVMQLLK